MSARYALAWSTGATVGLLVGAVLGQSVRDLAALSAARRTLAGRGAPQPLSGHGETTGAGNGAQAGAQREGTLDVGDLHERPDYQEAVSRTYPWEPGVDLTKWMAERGLLHPLDEVAAEFGIDLADDDAPCPATLGRLTCERVGPHDEHWWTDTQREDA